MPSGSVRKRRNSHKKHFGTAKKRRAVAKKRRTTSRSVFKQQSFGAPRRPGLFGRSHHKKARKSKGKRQGFGSEVGPGYKGVGYPGTYADYFGEKLPFPQPTSWFWPVNQNGAAAIPQMLASYPE